MIFKFQDVREDGSLSWEYFDNITSASAYYDESIGRNCVALYFGNDCEDGMIIPVNKQAYLMNDNGKTIDKFYGNAEIQSMLADSKIDLEKSPKS